MVQNAHECCSCIEMEAKYIRLAPFELVCPVRDLVPACGIKACPLSTSATIPYLQNNGQSKDDCRRTNPFSRPHFWSSVFTRVPFPCTKPKSFLC